MCIDSRLATDRCLFVCLPGAKHDAHTFLDAAISAGAQCAIVTEPAAFETLRSRGVAVALVDDPTDACWRACKLVYGDPTSKVQMVGVTGTNGKTTTAWTLVQLLNACGLDTGYMGTLGASFKATQFPMAHTTPFAPEANEVTKRLTEAGAKAIVAEVSSHALAQRRVDGFEFKAAIFTNLSHDHLDFHGNMEAYFQAKKRLFTQLGEGPPPVGIFNVDDPFGARLFSESDSGVDYGVAAKQLRLASSEAHAASIDFRFEYQSVEHRARANIGGEFNIMNCLATIGGAITLGVDAASAAENLKHVSASPGRFESVPTNAEFQIIVDYAHTPDALEKLLSSVAKLNPNRILTVFGCGGDRDKHKRPEMGAAVAKYSTKLFITSDNPRTEDAVAIIRDILPGIATAVHVVEPDRAIAIREAIHEAEAGDIVVIAGKGHEDYQIIGNEKLPFDDREVAASAAAAKTGGAS